MTDPKAWRTYEEVAAALLTRVREEFALGAVEGKQSLHGASGTNWEIDARGIRAQDGATVIIEARRYTTSRLDQEALGALAFRIRDVGGAGGIIVTPLPLQEGAQKVAQSANIQHVTLNADATPNVFAMRFLNHLRLGVSGVEATAETGTPTVKLGD